MRRRTASALCFALVAAGVVVPAAVAVAQDRTGDVTVTVPRHIVLDGSSVPVTVSSRALQASTDSVTVVLSDGSGDADTSVVQPNRRMRIATTGLAPSTATVLRVRFVTTPCDLFDGDPCHLDSSGYYEYVDGLTLHPSNAAVAKYGSRLVLQASRSGHVVTWTATATRWDGSDWTAWTGAALTSDSGTRSTDDSGQATWTERTDVSETTTELAAESDTVWAASATATVGALTPDTHPRIGIAPSTAAHR